MSAISSIGPVKGGLNRGMGCDGALALKSQVKCYVLNIDSTRLGNRMKFRNAKYAK